MKNKPTIAISPISNGYLTKGKEYEIVSITQGHASFNKLGYFFQIINDHGSEVFSNEKESGHINGLNWILK